MRYVFNRTVYRFSRKAFRFIISFFSILSVLVITCSAASLSAPEDIQVSGGNLETSHGSQITRITSSQEDNAFVFGTSAVRLFSGGVRYNSNWFGIRFQLRLNFAGKKGTFTFKLWNSNGAIDSLWSDSLGTSLKYSTITTETGGSVYQQYECSYTGTMPSSIDMWCDCTINGTQTNLNFYVYDFTFVEEEEERSYPQPDSSITSNIDSVEQGEQSLIDSTQSDYQSAVESGNDTVLSFLRSASQGVLFIKDLFNSLVSNNINIIVMSSIFLAVLPVILGLFTKLR